MLVAYLYETTEDTLYQQEWSPIYDLEKTLPLFSDTTLENFTGIRGLIFEDKKIVDAALIYQKKR